MSVGSAWLAAQQNGDGGWGGELGAPSSIEETALAVDALAASSCWGEQLEGGVGYLIERTQSGTEFPPTPIGFYFAKLWYFEKLYPMAWTVSALERVRKRSAG